MPIGVKKERCVAWSTLVCLCEKVQGTMDVLAVKGGGGVRRTHNLSVCLAADIVPIAMRVVDQWHALLDSPSFYPSWCCHVTYCASSCSLLPFVVCW